MTGEGERRNRVKDFSFDFSYWSVDDRSRNYASQERVSEHSSIALPRGKKKHI